MLLEAGADPNASRPGYTILHAIARVRKPGVGDNNPPPEGSGKMSSIEFIKKIAARGANLNARMTQKVNLKGVGWRIYNHSIGVTSPYNFHQAPSRWRRSLLLIDIRWLKSEQVRFRR